MIAAVVIMVTKASARDKSESKKTSVNQDDLSVSLNTDLDDLRRSEITKKKQLKTRKDFIQRQYKIIASFYNNYKFIDYAKKPNKKIAKKQMQEIIVLDKNLNEMDEFFGQDSTEVDYKMILVGVITFKLLKKETLNKVNLDLVKLYKKGELLQFDGRLMDSLRNILVPFKHLDE